ncbi:hypothetical protein [uncultured Desulfobacter sp.]|uniref:hypothetical protein n=1 Tax=uncultured Desulfobacter sp. TaxID=240139 RepID=UPI0029F5010A|nr:hypothetical protein [uncultured Desulfobacter sp.]
MLNKLSIKQRMLLIISMFFILFICMVLFSIKGSNHVKDISAAAVSKIMLEDQKDKNNVYV